MCDCLKRRHPKIHWFRTSFYLFELYLVGTFPIAKHTHFCLPKNIPFGGLLHEPSVRPKFSMATIDAPSQHLYFWCQDMAGTNPFSESMFGAEKNTPNGDWSGFSIWYTHAPFSTCINKKHKGKIVHQSIAISALCHHLSSIMLVASFHQPMDDNSRWAFSTCRTLLVHTQGIQKKRRNQ